MPRECPGQGRGVIVSRSGLPEVRFQDRPGGPVHPDRSLAGFLSGQLQERGIRARSLEVKVSIDETTAFEAKLELAAAEASGPSRTRTGCSSRGTSFYAEDKYAEAAASYQDAVKLSPTPVVLLFQPRAGAQEARPGPRGAGRFRQGPGAQPRKLRRQQGVGREPGRAGNWRKRRTLYLKAVEISADDPDVLYNLGLSQAARARREAAIDSFDKCIALKPDYAEAYYQLGTLHDRPEQGRGRRRPTSKNSWRLRPATRRRRSPGSCWSPSRNSEAGEPGISISS